MKKVILISLVLSLAFSTAACSGNSGDNDVAGVNDITGEKQIIKDYILIVFETGIETEFSISDEDYNKYNEIMDYLNENYERSEPELFEELAKIYGESPEELNSFVNDNMQNAILRDMAGNTVTEDNVDNLVNKFIEENIIGDNVLVNSIDSKTPGIGAISHVDLEVDGNEHNLIVKFQFSDDYKIAEVIQIKIDGFNIDFQ